MRVCGCACERARERDRESARVGVDGCLGASSLLSSRKQGFLLQKFAKILKIFEFGAVQRFMNLVDPEKC